MVVVAVEIMPFCKRAILPKDVSKPDGRRLRGAQQKQSAEVFGDLADVCGFTLCSLLRQLSDLSRHSVSILEELEGELASVCHRSCALEGRVVRLQRHVADLISKPPPRSKSKQTTGSVVVSNFELSARRRGLWRANNVRARAERFAVCVSETVFIKRGLFSSAGRNCVQLRRVLLES